MSSIPTSRSIVIESTPSAIEKVCSQILVELERGEFCQEDVFAVHLALEEAFINAARHGNKMDPGKEIRIDYSVDLEKVAITVADEGSGFDPDKVPDPRCGDNIYRAEGRGVLLIRSYMDVVEYNEQGNGVRMIKYRKQKPEN